MRDVVVIGGGIAGLASAWRLRNRDIVVLESEQRVGGRIRSERRGEYWLNWGAHVYAGGGSSTDWLLNSTGVDVAPITGVLTALAMNGKLLTGGRIETYPFRIPMSNRARFDLIRATVKVSTAVARYAKLVQQRPGESPAARQQRIYNFMNDQSFAEFIGPLTKDAEAFFKPTVTRSAADLDEISAGAGVGYFSLVWGIGGGLTNGILGGPATLTESIAGALGDRVFLRSTVHEVEQRRDSVIVRYERDGTASEMEARYAVLATPATVASRVAVNLDPDIKAALSKVIYGPYVSAAFLTNETSPQVWDGTYSIATPNRSFNIILNQASLIRARESHRKPGGSIMTFSPASIARALLEKSDDEIRDTYIADLDAVLPGFASHVAEAHVQRWYTGAPYCFPGRAKLQPVLTRRDGRIQLAGDYLGTLYTETAIATGLMAAQEVQSRLGSDCQSLDHSFSYRH
jgi:oxygen-dependent protoporphyrinogen oxidase